MSPSCLQDTAWWARGSNVISGQSGQQVPLEVSGPSHHIIAKQNSLGSKCILGSIEVRRDGESRQALSAGDDVSNSLLNARLSSLWQAKSTLSLSQCLCFHCRSNTVATTIDLLEGLGGRFVLGYVYCINYYYLQHMYTHTLYNYNN